MEQPREQLANAAIPRLSNSRRSNRRLPRDLAFRTLSEEMVERMKRYGREETFPEGVTLYTSGDRNTEMLVVLEEEMDITLPSSDGKNKVFTRLRKFDFSGELSLLNSQRAVTEAKTASATHLLRISRSELRLLMRAEGDIANIIVSAAIWRRIGIIEDTSSGVVIRGCNGNADLMHLQRFWCATTTLIASRRSPPITNRRRRARSGIACRGLIRWKGDGPAVYFRSRRRTRNNEIPDLHTAYDVAVVGAGPSRSCCRGLRGIGRTLHYRDRGNGSRRSGRHWFQN